MYNDMASKNGDDGAPGKIPFALDRATNPSNIIWESYKNTIYFGKLTRKLLLALSFLAILIAFYSLNMKASYMVAFFRYL